MLRAAHIRYVPFGTTTACFTHNAHRPPTAFCPNIKAISYSLFPYFSSGCILITAVSFVSAIASKQIEKWHRYVHVFQVFCRVQNINNEIWTDMLWVCFLGGDVIHYCCWGVNLYSFSFIQCNSSQLEGRNQGDSVTRPLAPFRWAWSDVSASACSVRYYTTVE